MLLHYIEAENKKEKGLGQITGTDGGEDLMHKREWNVRVATKRGENTLESEY